MDDRWGGESFLFGGARRPRYHGCRMSMKGILRGFLCVAMAPAFGQNAGAPPAFSYEGANGPARWGELSPEYSVCKTGKGQSPIDIRNPKTTSLPPLRFDYKSVPLKLINNGHTAQANYEAGSAFIAGGERYELKQLHFHHPSEERINGRSFDMVIHLVHSNSSGQTAVVAIL